jgi:predicted DNA binding CopG/RHH family protein
MALYSLLFGHAEWPEDRPFDSTQARDVDALDRDERLSVRVPDGLRQRVEASAALEGVPAEAWIVRALSSCLDPRLLEVSR